MGWSTFRERLIKGKLRLVKKIEGLEEDRWVNQVLSESSVRSSWKRETERWKRRENLEGDWYRIDSRVVKQRIEKDGLVMWQA